MFNAPHSHAAMYEVNMWLNSLKEYHPRQQKVTSFTYEPDE